MTHDRVAAHEVGPVLLAGRVADAIVSAIRAQNPGARVAYHGSYVRVSVAGRCDVDRVAIERLLGEPFRLPGDLERVMPSFRGRLLLSDDLASWEVGAPPAPATGRAESKGS
jgi:toluene monooxygenase system protein D